MTKPETAPEKKPTKALLPLAALSGALAGFAALAVAEAVAGGTRPQAGPVVAVGGAAIDRTPAAVKDWAIRHFGTDDKLFLQLRILAVLALFALALGIVALRFRRTGAAGVLLFGVVGALAATGRPDSTGITDALPSVAGAVVGAVVLYVLVARLRPRVQPQPQPQPRTSPSAAGWDRRGFVIAASAAAVGSAGAGLLGRSLSGAGGRNAVASRRNLVLPTPGSRARPVPKEAGLRIPDVSPFLTANADHRQRLRQGGLRQRQDRQRQRLHHRHGADAHQLTSA